MFQGSMGNDGATRGVWFPQDLPAPHDYTVTVRARGPVDVRRHSL